MSITELNGITMHLADNGSIETLMKMIWKHIGMFVIKHQSKQNLKTRIINLGW